MSRALVLASQSAIRQRMMENAALNFRTVPAKVDEPMVRDALIADGAQPRDIADALAEAKARKISDRMPGMLVLGCDQVLSLGGRPMNKPESPQEARAQLTTLRGQRHELISAAVICEDGEPIWRHVGEVKLTMRRVSDAYIETYLARNWHSARGSVGAYKLEEEGIRLFSRIDGDHFTALGLPLLELLSFLTMRGDLET